MKITLTMEWVQYIDDKAFRRRAGDVVEVDEFDAERLVRCGAATTGEVPTTAHEDVPAVEDVVADDLPETESMPRPKNTAPREKWAQYARSLGWSDEKLEGMTKEEIISGLS